MKSKFSLNSSGTKLSALINNPNKDILIRKNGIIFILMRVYLIVPDDLKYLLRFKNYFYIYYPIRNSDFLQNKKISVISKHNNYKICLTKRDIIDEVKNFLGINKNSCVYDFDLYNQNLGILKNEYQLMKVETIYNNIIYAKIKLNKEQSEIKSYNDIRKVPKIMKLKNYKSKFIDYIMKLRKESKENNSQLNLQNIINDTLMINNQDLKKESKKRYGYLSRNVKIRKIKSISGFLSQNCTNKSDKNTTTDDLEQITNGFRIKKINKNGHIMIESFKNSLVNNINSIAKNIHNNSQLKKNLSSLDYNPNFQNIKTNNLGVKLVNNFRTIRNIKRKLAFRNQTNIGNMSIRDMASYSYQDRKKFVKSLYEHNNSNISRNKKYLHLSQPNIIKTYMEVYHCNLNNNL